MLGVSPLAYKGETSLFRKGRFFFWFFLIQKKEVFLLVFPYSEKGGSSFGFEFIKTSVVFGDSLGQSFSSPEQCLGVEVLLVRRCILGNRRRSDFSEHQGDGESVLRRS